MNKIFCCDSLQRYFENAGSRGAAVLAHKTATGVLFLLQPRGIAFEDVEKIRPNPGASDMMINVSAERAIHYCPHCGTSLQALLHASPAEFEELAGMHAKYYTGP